MIGVVTHASFGGDYVTHPADVTYTLTNDLDEREEIFTLGPIQLHLVGGGRLEVPAGTPGANGCPELMTEAQKLAVTGLAPPLGVDEEQVRLYGPRSPVCLVIASLAADGDVARFEVLPTDDGGHAEVGGLLEAVDGGVLTESTYVFPLAEDVALDCVDSVSIEGLLDGDDGDAAGHVAFVDPTAGVIVSVACYYGH